MISIINKCNSINLELDEEAFLEKCFMRMPIGFKKDYRRYTTLSVKIIDI